MIESYDEEGIYLESIFYQYEKVPLQLSELDLGTPQTQLIEENPGAVPSTWPAIHTMEMDNKGRFWVSTITESDTTFQWWVLESNGSLLARFSLPGRKTARSVINKPFYKINNGFFNTRERDISNGINRIVKYQIVSDTLNWD